MLALFQDDVPDQAGSDFGNKTEVLPLGLAALGVLLIMALLLPRRWAALPAILLLCFIPAGQRVVISTIDFSFIRIMMMVIWMRLVVRAEVRPIVWNHLDRVMIAWAVIAVVTGTLQGATLSIFINRVGSSVDAMMVYFFFRLVIRSHEDLAALATMFMVCGFAVAGFFLIENRTQQNMFYVFGGVPQFTDVRDGRLRCQGAFAHSILAGCFWACIVPFYMVRGWLKGDWLLPAFASVASLLIVALCASSTPVMAVGFGILGGALFLLRGALRWIRWLVFGWLCVLHFFLMKMPVWHLLARVDIVGGSTGWHRYHLVDKFFERFPEWYLVGTPRTGHWGPGLHDVTNEFVAEGVAGGILRLAAYVMAIWLSFAGVSRSMRYPGGSRAYRYCAWALGTALFMHCMNYIAVTYFEQIVVEYYVTLAAISSLTLVPGARVREQVYALQAATV